MYVITVFFGSIEQLENNHGLLLNPWIELIN